MLKCPIMHKHIPSPSSQAGNIFKILHIHYRHKVHMKGFSPYQLRILHLIMLSSGCDELSIQLSNIFKMVYYYNITEEDVFKYFEEI